MIKNIVFDFGRVLIDYDYPTLLRSLLARLHARGYELYGLTK